ncbi:MAG: leucine--tRNA ligase [Chloroflexota bacterium]
MTQNTYDFESIQSKWRAYWHDIDLYRTGDDPQKDKKYILDFFPYPSGAGLSVGHCRNYVPTCIFSRYRRMKGDNVLHPMGWDAFGLPAENYAIQHGVHPRNTIQEQSANYKRQLQLIECSYDWSREINSSDPGFFHWTQWFFLLLYKRGLAYRAEGEQWWCPVDKTILANEQVENGRCWRCGSTVEKKTLEQWYFKITAYADRLLDDLDLIDWPDSIVAMQRNWIGRSAGADITFEVKDASETISVFTTRPDTLFGATFLALAPEHPRALDIATEERRASVEAFIEEARRARDNDGYGRDDGRDGGVFSGRYAIHPFSGAEIPIYIAGYVLMEYGSGAIMGVPAHDERDAAFASRHDLPVTRVVKASETPEANDAVYTGQGTLIDSGPYSGLASEEAARRIGADLQAKGAGGPAVRYRLRDWLISRQRYWGAPIPIVHCQQCGIVPLPESELPLLLPEIEAFTPADDGRSPLARAEDWVSTTCPQCGGAARRETDTMDGFACSSWYFLRFASPHEEDRPFDPDAVRYWLPVDLYVGGAEHAVLHLLYARFWTKVMFDAGLIDFREPFTQLRNQGVLHAADGARMSKSRGNVVTPDEVAEKYGVDALRTYIVFIGPFEASVDWNERGIRGVTRFLDRFWTLATGVPVDEDDEQEIDEAFQRNMHQVIKRVDDDLQAFKFNTAVAALMGWLNDLYEAREQPISGAQWRDALETFCLLLAPVAPFITEEVWHGVLGHEQSVHRQSWPAYDPALLERDELTIAVQVNGRLRDTITVPADIDEQALRDAALARPAIRRHVDGKAIRRTVVVPGRVINIVV